MSSLVRKLAFSLVFKKAQKAAAILTVSQYSMDQIIAQSPKTAPKITVTHLGVEKDFFLSPEYGKIRLIQAQFHITKPYIFFTSAWRPHKNLVGLVKAFAQIRTEGKKDIQLVLGGNNDNHYPELLETLAALPESTRTQIITPGFIDEKDLPWLYRGALATVIPSFEEGFGLNGLEAMACGSPVVSSNAASLPEVYGDAALYADPRKPEEFAQAIIRLMDEPALSETMRERGLAQGARYSWDAAAVATAAVYKKVLG